MSIPQECHGFVLQRSKAIPARGITMHMYKHKKFGCEFLYVESQEPTNTFCVHVRTPLINDSGTPHMLEHLVLNGSKKYPIKNCFFRLLSRSYSCFMNALTFPELTAFPFSTINEKDFFNNLDVYLDCVFHPNLSELDFLAECHHLEFQDNDPEKELKHSGVILNEMSGSFSDPSRIFSNKLRRILYPDSVTRFCAGGMPSEIPNAKLSELRYLHDTYYHPVNAQFTFFGRIKIEKVFEKVAQSIDSFEFIQNPYNWSHFDLKDWEAPKHVDISVSSDPQLPIEEQYALTVSYVIKKPITDDHLVSGISSLAELLADHNDSPLKKALVDTGISKTATISFNTSNYYPALHINVKGMSKDKFEVAEKAIFECLQEVYEKGVDIDRFEDDIHNKRLSNKMQSSNTGISLLYSTIIQWIHGADPLELFDFSKNLEILNENGHKPDYFKNLLKEYLIDNKHCVIARTIPDATYFETEQQKAKEDLQKLKDSLTEAQKQEIVEQFKQIDVCQKAEQPIDLLPSIHTEDLGDGVKFRPPDVVKDGVAMFVTNTDGLSRIFVTMELPKDFPDVNCVSFLLTTMMKLGAGPYNDVEFEKFVNKWFSMATLTSLCRKRDDGEAPLTLEFAAYVLDDEIEKFGEIVKYVLTECHFDNYDRLEKTMKEAVLMITRNLRSNPLTFIQRLASGTISDFMAFNHRMGGIDGMKALLKLLTEKTPQEISVLLKNLLEVILKVAKFEVVCSVSKEKQEKVFNVAKQIVNDLKDYSQKLNTSYEKVDNTSLLPYSKPIYVSLPMKSGYMCCCSKVHLDNDVERFRFEVLSQIMKHEVFTKVFRELRGCYGANVDYDTNSEIFSIKTYRDLHPCENSKMIFDLIEQSKSAVNKETVEHACIKLLTHLDQPDPPQVDGLWNYIFKTKKELYNLARETFLDTKPEHLMPLFDKIPKEFATTVITCESVEKAPEDWEILKIEGI